MELLDNASRPKLDGISSTGCRMFQGSIMKVKTSFKIVKLKKIKGILSIQRIMMMLQPEGPVDVHQGGGRGTEEGAEGGRPEEPRVRHGLPDSGQGPPGADR